MEYEQEILDTELRPEFVASVQAAQRDKFKRVKNVSEFSGYSFCANQEK